MSSVAWLWTRWGEKNHTVGYYRKLTFVRSMTYLCVCSDTMNTCTWLNQWHHLYTLTTCLSRSVWCHRLLTVEHRAQQLRTQRVSPRIPTQCLIRHRNTLRPGVPTSPSSSPCQTPAPLPRWVHCEAVIILSQLSADWHSKDCTWEI